MQNFRTFALTFLVIASIATQGISQGLIVPAYFYPDSGGASDRWYQLAAASTWLKNNGQQGFTNLIAIGNPASGPGTLADPKYLSAFRRVRLSGGKVIGYVSTNYGKRSYASIKADIDTWVRLYGTQLDGIFLDEWFGHTAGNIPNVTPVKSYFSLYQDLYWLVRTFHRLPICVANPGVSFANNETNPDAAWQADIFVLHEQTYANSSNYTLPLWLQTSTHSNKGSVLIHSMPANAPVTATQLIQSAKRKRAKWIYVTEDLLPNPWDTIPGEASGGLPNQWNSYWGNVQWSIGSSF